MNDEKKVINVFANRNYRLVFFGALVSELGALLYTSGFPRPALRKDL